MLELRLSVSKTMIVNMFTKLLLLAFVGVHLRVSEATEIRVDTSLIIHTTSDKFISVAIDSGVLRRHWEKFKPSSVKVMTLASALTPCYLRVGGTDADFLIFDDGTGTEQITHASNRTTAQVQPMPAVLSNVDNVLRFKPSTLSRSKRDIGLDRDRTNYTMSAELYDQLHKFVFNVGFDLIFDLNVLLRRGADWYPDNAIKLIQYTASHGYKMAGWELGNEPDDYTVFHGQTYIAPVQLVKDVQTLRDLISRFPVFDGGVLLGPSVVQLDAVQRVAYFSRLAPEQLAKDYVHLGNILAGYKEFQNCTVLGPSTTRLVKKHIDEFFESFLINGGKDVVTAATFHQYYINGRTATMDDFINPDTLNVLYDEVQMGVNLTRESGSKAAPWIGETSSAWGGGAEGLSDRYVAAFMWLDKLGISAAWGIDVIIRQTFYGGHYALIDSNTLDPNPDYWLTLMYKTLVGNRVLSVTSPSSKDTLRVYVHCVNTKRSEYQAGAVVFYIMNMGESSVSLTFPDLPSNSPIHRYMFTPEGGDLKSQNVLLNGQLLQMVDDSTLPNLLIPVKGTVPVEIESLTYSFIVFPEAGLLVCK